MDFETFVADLLSVADDRHDEVETFFRKAIIRALGPPISRLRADWTEKSTTFETEADAKEYDSSVGTGFPADIGDIDRLGLDPATHNRAWPIEPRSLQEVRAGQVAASGEPRIYCWHHRKLLIAPPTKADQVLLLDYTIDARRDETTGALITENDTTTSNAWFRLGEGHDLLRCRVLADYYGSFARDGQLAAVYAQFFEAARREARSQYQNLRADGVQAPFTMGNDDFYGPFNRVP